MSTPLIIYVPGLLPKPKPELHREALLRCLLTSVRRIDPDVAAEIEAQHGAFDVVSWTFDFYRQHRDFELDRRSIDAVVAQTAASDRDRAEASAWTRRLTRWIYRLGDLLPFLIPHVASERMEVHLRDLHRYVNDENGIAEHTRRMLKVPLLAAARAGQPILLIGHSMGSVIAFDTLWQLTHRHESDIEIDLWLTMGSPLGQRFLRKRVKGFGRDGADQYPAIVKRWKNLSAIGDLTAIDPWLANDYAEMLDLGLVDSIEDEGVWNWFRLDGVLNVHSEYGYLVNDATARVVANWWRENAI